MSSGKAPNAEKVFNALAVLIVYLVSFSLPVFVSLFIMEDAKNARIKMDMGSLKNWAQIYRTEKGSYKGFEISPELYIFFEDIKLMKGEAKIFISKDYELYCARAIFRKASLCVDSSGYIGKDKGVCSPSVTRCN